MRRPAASCGCSTRSTADAARSSLGVNRGVVFWESGDDRRILVAAGQRLYALDAQTGKPIPSFGEKGSVSLLEGLGRDVSKLYVLSNTPGGIYKDLLILGTRVSEGPGPAAPGHIRAYDVRTGKIRWTFHTIPSPGEFGYDTWPPDAWTRVGGANAWSGITVDTARGLVFLPIGSAAFDFWGGNRHGANLFANCVLALKADTGERVWHYQFVHHDLWDRDLPAAPVLVTVQRDGRAVDAVAQATKSGYVFVFDRETGTPAVPDRGAPGARVRSRRAKPPGQRSRFPLEPPPFARQRLTEADLTDISPAAHAAVLAQFRKVRSNGQFVPPSTQGTVIFPGFDGGAEWGGSAFDRPSGLPLRERERDAVDPHDGGPEEGGHRPRRRRPPDLRHELRGVPRRRTQGRRDERVPVDCGGLEEAVARPGRGDHPARQGRHAVVRIPQRNRSEDARRVPLRRRRTAPRPARSQRGARRDDPLLAHRLQPVPRSGRLPGGEAALGHAERDRSEQGHDRVDRHARRAAGTRRKQGIPPTGTENYGGPIVTAGGLLFIGATKDEKFRAFDRTTGRVLWETSLPAGGYATPATYAVGGRAVRRHRGRRRQDGHEVGRRVRGVCVGGGKVVLVSFSVLDQPCSRRSPVSIRDLMTEIARGLGTTTAGGWQTKASELTPEDSELMTEN